MPYTKKVHGKIRNLEPVTKIFIRNNITITRNGGGKIVTATIDDGTYAKLLTITRDGNGKIIGISATPQE